MIMAAAAAAQFAPEKPARPTLPVRICKERPEQKADLSPGQKLMLAANGCPWCRGVGDWPLRSKKAVCKCVERAIFNACMAEYFRIVDAQTSGTRVHCNIASRKRAGIYWGRRSEEYLADVELLARRTLDLLHWKIFRLHFLAGLEWSDCCRLLPLSRGNFFHSVYRIQERLGRAFYQTRPYPLYPVKEYFQ